MHMLVITPARAATVATHSWTKLDTQIMSWVSGILMSVPFMHGPNSTTVNNLHCCEQLGVEGL